MEHEHAVSTASPVAGSTTDVGCLSNTVGADCVLGKGGRSRDTALFSRPISGTRSDQQLTACGTPCDTITAKASLLGNLPAALDKELLRVPCEGLEAGQ